MESTRTSFWFQKHPTPSESTWGFHWHPRAGAAEQVAQRFTRGRVRHPFAALWLDGSTLWWLRSFSARAASEQRDYAGLVVEKLVPMASSAALEELLHAASCAPAGPWQRQHSAEGDPEPGDADTDELAGAIRQAAEGLILAGPTRVDALAAALPRGVLALARFFPNLRARLAAGVIWAGDGEHPDAGARTMAHYLAACAGARRQERAEPCRQCWSLAESLAHADGLELRELFAELAELSRAWESAAALESYLRRRIPDAAIIGADARAPAPLFKPDIADAGWLWNRVCNYWGRGFLPAETGSALAGVLVRRVIVDHLYRIEHPDGPRPSRYLDRLRLEALLPGSRVRAMLELAAERGLQVLAP